MNTMRLPGEIWIDHAGNECEVRENGTIRVTTVNNLPSMTVQSEKDSCDINKIVAKFGMKNRPIKAIANELLMTSHVRREQPQYGDFTQVSDYATAVIMIQEAGESFMQLPAALRKRFSNDPGQLLEFLGNPENRSEAIKLGLVVAPQDVKDPQGEVAPPTTEGG